MKSVVSHVVPLLLLLATTFLCSTCTVLPVLDGNQNSGCVVLVVPGRFRDG